LFIVSNSVGYDSDKDNEYIPEIKNKTKLSYDDINEEIITIDSLNIPEVNNKSVKNNESHNMVENDNKKGVYSWLNVRIIFYIVVYIIFFLIFGLNNKFLSIIYQSHV